MFGAEVEKQNHSCALEGIGTQNKNAVRVWMRMAVGYSIVITVVQCSKSAIHVYCPEQRVLEIDHFRSADDCGLRLTQELAYDSHQPCRGHRTATRIMSRACTY